MWRKSLMFFFLFFIGAFLSLASVLERVEKLLERDDKVTLGGGKMVVFAPEFPLFQDYPGFWDHAVFLNYKVEPVFTVSFLDEDYKEIELKIEARRWFPSHVVQTYREKDGLALNEVKFLHPRDVLVSEFKIKNQSSKPRTLYAALWTAQPISEGAQKDWQHFPRGNFIKEITIDSSRASFLREYQDERGEAQMRVAIALGSSEKAASFYALPSEGRWNYPYWRLTPFYEFDLAREKNKNLFRGTRDKNHSSGNLYTLLFYPVEIKPGEERVLRFGAAISGDVNEASKNLKHSLSPASFDESQKEWNEFFASVPDFNCSDPYIEKYYWYRWYDVKLNLVDTGGRFNLPYPCVFEGVNAGWFRHHISYSAQIHMKECRWMHEPAVAQGSLLNFIANQKEDGNFTGGIMTEFKPRALGFYHGNWGAGVRELFRVHPDVAYLKKVYPGLKKYLDYFERERDKEDWNLYDVQNMWETGQEYMSRYMFVDPEADTGKRIQLKGIDATVYIYELQKNLSWMAKKLGFRKEEKFYRKEANRTRQAILEKMWDDEKAIFFDVHPENGEKSPYKAAVCFYPFMTDIARKEHLVSLDRYLFNPEEFWTPHPVPSTSVDDPYFSQYGCWEDKRRNCPWNGRMWLMTQSHIAEVIAESAINFKSKKLREKTSEFMSKFIQTLYLGRDLRYPTSYEYYNPFNGKAPVFRGVDDYMHSWIVDLIIKYVAGIRVYDEEVVVDPFPFNLSSFHIERVKIKDHFLKVTYSKEEGLRVYMDGKLVGKSKKLKALKISL